VAASRFPELFALIEQSSAGFGDVEITEAHGCDALSAAGRAYALVAPGGRIGVRLPDWDLFAAAFELPGSAPLYESEQRIGHWVLLPEDVQEDRAALGEWLRHAHALTASRV
jgi:hypothetical protein